MSEEMYSSYSDSMTEDHQHKTTDASDTKGIYAVMMLCECRSAVVRYENLLTLALMGVNEQGDGLTMVLRCQSQLNKVRNQLTLLERDYVEFGG